MVTSRLVNLIYMNIYVYIYNICIMYAGDGDEQLHAGEPRLRDVRPDCHRAGILYHILYYIS
jgi:hypothetical protein